MVRQKTNGPKQVLRLRQLRREREMTQRELARRVDMSPQSINAIEQGRAKPSFDKGLAIAAVFGMPAEEVFAYVEVPA